MIKTIANDFGQNTYILSSAKERYIVDPGSNTEAILEALALKKGRLDAVLLTHGHFDHILSLNAVLDAYDVPVYIHPLERDFLFDPSLNLSTHIQQNFRLKHKDRLRVLEPDQTFAFGSNALKYVWTPGHSRGSVCYYSHDILISGDLLFKETVGRTDLPTSDPAALHHSLKHIFSMFSNNTKVYPGHGSMTTIIHETLHNPYVKGR
jgi:hydroxyacylglutathione hydrolase